MVFFTSRKKVFVRVREYKESHSGICNGEDERAKKGEDDTFTRAPKKVYDSIVSHTFKVGFIGSG